MGPDFLYFFQNYPNICLEIYSLNLGFTFTVYV